MTSPSSSTPSFSSPSLQQVADRLRTSSRVVWVTGAGLSVASGIPPYRRSKDAVWARFLTEWGTIEKFRDDTLGWWKEFWLKAHGALFDRVGGIHPNAGHRAITAMCRAHPSHVVITQNIDGLHRTSGLPDAQLIEIHGRHDVSCCTNERCSRAREPVGHIDLSCIDDDEVPECEVCGAPMRPVVLLFDETYDSHPLYQMRRARQLLNDSDTLVFVGTSFAVGITDLALRAGQFHDAMLVNINIEPAQDLGPESSGVSPSSFVELNGPAELVLPALAQAAGVTM